MSSSRLLFAVILVVGIVLLIMGFNASDSLSSELSEAFDGAPSDKAIWLIVGGVIAAAFGAIGLMRKRVA
jgi:hypothetical protein